MISYSIDREIYIIMELLSSIDKRLIESIQQKLLKIWVTFQ